MEPEERDVMPEVADTHAVLETEMKPPSPENMKTDTIERDLMLEVADRHAVLETEMKPPFPENMKTAIFGMGCFWGVEETFWKQPDIYSTQVGYCGGDEENPLYKDVFNDVTGHAEVVRVVYDPEKTTYRDLLKVANTHYKMFWENHNPSQGNRQGKVIGKSFRSAIFCENEDEEKEAEHSRDCYQRALMKNRIHDKITTEIKIVTDFWYAEDYHQQYLHKLPDGYCPAVGTGVKYECKCFDSD